MEMKLVQQRKKTRKREKKQKVKGHTREARGNNRVVGRREKKVRYGRFTKLFSLWSCELLGHVVLLCLEVICKCNQW